MSVADHRRLVDPRLGLIRRIVDFEMPDRLPRGLITRGADVANSVDPSVWNADRAAIGANFDDPARAEQAAIGEAVERYCGNRVPSGLRRAAYDDLVRAGASAIDPTTLVLYSDRQYDAAGFPFVRFTRDLQVAWTAGDDLFTGDPCWAPASLVYCNYHWGERAEREPLTNGLIYAGIAAGPTREFAEASALEELIERDATEIWWHSGAPARGLDVSGERRIVEALTTAADDPRIRYHFFEIPTGFDVHVIGCLLDDEELSIVGAGFACRPDPVEAALKALSEAIGTWFYSTGILDPEGSIWQAVAAGGLDPRAYKPWREDRRYLDDFSPDFRDVIDLGAQMQFYLDPRARVHVTRMTDPEIVIPIGELRAVDVGGDERSHLLNQLARRGFGACSIDVTTSDVRRAGLHAVRVVAPGLYTNAPAATPYLGGDRLYAEPVEHGWMTGPLTEDDLVLAPIPHV